MGSSIRGRILLTAIVMSSVSSHLALAATLKVPSQFPTIQAAVTAAIPGDTIVVSSGTYAEAIDIPNGKDALVLRGKGSVIIDASPAGVASGAGISVGSTQVTIRNLTIRHAQDAGDNGDGIRSTSLGTTIEDVVVQQCDGAGILLSGDDATVRDTTISGCANGISATADRITIRKVNIAATTAEGIDITGDDADIRSTSVTQASADALVVSGASAIIRKCTVARADGTGIDLNGDNGEISRCDVSNTGDHGIQTDGRQHGRRQRSHQR